MAKKGLTSIAGLGNLNVDGDNVQPAEQKQETEATTPAQPEQPREEVATAIEKPIQAEQPQEVAPVIEKTVEQPVAKEEQKKDTEGEENIRFSRDEVIDMLLDENIKYNNSKQPVLIDLELRRDIELMSKLSGADISRIINNLLYQFFSENSKNNIRAEIAKYISKKQKDILGSFSKK